ncbi:hypothetical protein [Nissabacter sp. SGAir0207]|uniref:hypothetical protein n=1 Tax=Nissabacter sp. SGAir0207 TaxID=2126321 RepID=UPI0010CCBDF5|nr:hypothetical protein [Nissabacter sp. SGAir0207]QCR38820.1 hypothetical protein C1N62_22060 [Nissabacter sp. SGAir0207]
MKKLIYTPKRGILAGEEYVPHLYEDGFYVVSETRFAKDYVKVRTLNEVYECYKRGFKIRMSHQQGNPSLISPGSIREV